MNMNVSIGRDVARPHTTQESLARLERGSFNRPRRSAAAHSLKEVSMSTTQSSFNRPRRSAAAHGQSAKRKVFR